MKQQKLFEVKPTRMERPCVVIACQDCGAIFAGYALREMSIDAKLECIEDIAKYGSMGFAVSVKDASEIKFSLCDCLCENH